ncbi:MAG: hypothetical protein IJ261_03725 [Clostridia bacterium]|nr:hypothetical protein [Clostridia bacterium]
MKSKTLDKWFERHREKGYKKFIYDGIVNEDEWEKSDVKVCFFLKEAYLLGSEESADLCRWLDQGLNKRMWHTVADWIFALESVTDSSIPSFDFIPKSDSEETARIKSCAIINIKKSDGKPNSEKNDLLDFLKEDSDLIREQFEEIKPEIIVCGNTAYFFQIAFGAEVNSKGSLISNAKYNGVEIDRNELGRKGFVSAGDKLIIDFCHPANRFDRMGKYYAFSTLYQQALLHNKKNA